MFVVEHKESGFRYHFDSLSKISSFLNVDLSYLSKMVHNMKYKCYNQYKIKKKEGFVLIYDFD